MSETESKPHIVCVITTETLWESIRKDISTVFILSAPIFLNHLTVQSTFLDFVIGLMFIIYSWGSIQNKETERVIRGKSFEEIAPKLKARIERLDS